MERAFVSAVKEATDGDVEKYAVFKKASHDYRRKGITGNIRHYHQSILNTIINVGS